MLVFERRFGSEIQFESALHKGQVQDFDCVLFRRPFWAGRVLKRPAKLNELFGVRGGTPAARAPHLSVVGLRPSTIEAKFRQAFSSGLF